MKGAWNFRPIGFAPDDAHTRAHAQVERSDDGGLVAVTTVGDVAKTLEHYLCELGAGRSLPAEVAGAMAEYTEILSSAAFPPAPEGCMIVACKGVRGGENKAKVSLHYVRDDGSDHVRVTKHTHFVYRTGIHADEPNQRDGRQVQLFGIWVGGEMVLAVPLKWNLYPYVVDDGAVARRDPAARLCRLLVSLASASDDWQNAIAVPV